MRHFPIAVIAFAGVLSLGLWLSTTGVVEGAGDLSPAPPDTTVVYNTAAPTLRNDNGNQIDMFAWKTFIALNWPAIHPGPANGYTRGIPDTTQSFGANKLAVWETFKEKREVFNHGTVTGVKFTPKDPGPWNSPIHYGPLRGADDEKVNSPQHHPVGRVFHATTKQPFNALDETVEVKSEARELDSKVKGKVVAPRVWRYNSMTKTLTPVLYEVKVNYDFYKYVRKFGLWNDATTDKLVAQNEVHLPWRTSATKGLPPASHQTKAKTGYSAADTAKTYATFRSKKSPPTTPPLIGSVHIKAAWIALTPKEIKAKTYHMAKAYSYKSTAAGQPVAVLSRFGLIGLHIIQRIHFSDSGGNFKDEGGTFVFATWEHNSIESSLDPSAKVYYEYSNYYDPPKNAIGPPPAGFYPPVANAYRVTRRPGAILSQTAAANTKVHGMLPSGSVWKNYNLIGTQFVAVDTPSNVLFSAPPSAAEEKLGQNSYLANLVIETNHGLQNFRGLPPLITSKYVVPPYGESSRIKPPIVGQPNSGPAFDRNGLNTAATGTGRNMGGCMGCHGVAQIQGFSFSFVLLGGNEGAKTDTETRFDLPIAKKTIK